MKKIYACAAALLVSLSAAAQISYKWTPVAIDSSYSEIKDSTATMIIRKYDPMLSSLYEVIGRSDAEYTATRPESGLSNFVADVIRERAEMECGRKVHLAMTNFGGIRTSLPEGNVTVYDILSLFPFNNRIEVFDINGSELVKFFNNNAGNPEALSGVKLVVESGKVTFLEVDGAPVDPERTYTFASIDFLLKGGDGIKFNGVTNLKGTGVVIREAIEDHIRRMTAAGKIISLKNDGRVVFKRTAR